jgi:23S rRNA pseudouridine2605 synthase
MKPTEPDVPEPGAAAEPDTTAKTRGASAGKPASDDDGGATMRLHKFLASTGAGSRRECETFVEQGRVTVNGKVVTKQGVKVDPSKDVVTLDGERVSAEERVYYLLNKPPGYICTNSDERGRPRAVDLIRDGKHRVYTVGRLDADSTGMILLTNDGEIANVVCHPRYRIEKTYQVVVRGEGTRERLAEVEAGVWLSEGRSSPARVRPVGRNPKRNETMLEITLFEGRNREVRRVFARVGLPVRRLTRTRIGPLELSTLPIGHYVRLPESALDFVREAERLYLANKEAWDAELPKEGRKERPAFRRPAPRRPRTAAGAGGGWGGHRGGHGGHGGGHGGGGGGGRFRRGAGGPPRGDRPFPSRDPRRGGGGGGGFRSSRPYGPPRGPGGGPPRGPGGPPRGPGGFSGPRRPEGPRESE